MTEGFIRPATTPGNGPGPTSPPSGNGSSPVTPEIAAAQELVKEAAPPPAPVEEWPIKVKLLHKKIRNDRNDVIDEVAFRQPTGGDINRYGNPCRISYDGEVQIDEQKMTRIIAALAGILLPNIEQMDPRDWNSCAYRLRSFFLPDLAAW
jgi:hypothetical protein